MLFDSYSNAYNKPEIQKKHNNDNNTSTNSTTNNTTSSNLQHSTIVITGNTVQSLLARKRAEKKLCKLNKNNNKKRNELIYDGTTFSFDDSNSNAERNYRDSGNNEYDACGCNDENNKDNKNNYIESDDDDVNNEEDKIMSACILAQMNYNRELNKKQQQKSRSYETCSNSSISNSSSSSSKDDAMGSDEIFISCSNRLKSTVSDIPDSNQIHVRNNRSKKLTQVTKMLNKVHLEDDEETLGNDSSLNEIKLERFDILKHRRKKANRI